MVRFEAGIRVRRPVEEVFAYLSDVDRQAEWSNAVQESHREGFGQVAKGTRYRTRIKFLGRTVDGLCEVSDYEPNRRIEFSSLSGPMPYRWDVEVQAVDGATALTSHGQAEPGGLFKVAGPVIRGAMKRQAENDFRTLKAILEGAS
jgi:uncharacterized protein YndB with AHSA1/START domain